MKHIFIAMTLSFASLPALAAEQDPVQLPESLTCKEVLNVFGSEKLSASPIVFGELNAEEASRLLGDDEAWGQVSQAKDDDLVEINFGDGEQIDSVTFKKEEVAALVKGESKTIRGLAKVGFWWADGDHIDSLKVLECSK